MARTYIIDGEAVLVSPGWVITDKINARTTLSITVVDLVDLDHIDNGDSIEVLDEASRIFAGIVVNVSEREPYPGMLEYGITASDNSALADKRLIAKVYENELAGDISSDLIPEKLGEEGVTAGIIQDGATIKKTVFNYVKCSEALNYLKKITGFAWNIDKDKKLNFFDRSTNKAPFELTGSLQHSNFSRNRSMDTYRNTQYVRGGRGKTASQANEVPTPRPDGQSRSYIIRYPVADKPVIEINLAGGGWTAVDPADIGVNGLDKNKKWYFTYNNQVITQDSSETVLNATGNDALRITYTGLRNLFVKIDDPAHISERAAAETGTSGIYESLASENSINDSSQAIQFAQGLIETYGQIKDDITFDTNVSGLEAGQLLTVKKPLYGINEDFLIESITVRPDGPCGVRYSVKALDGAAIGGWEEFFKGLLSSQKDFIIAENEVIILLQNQAETEGYQGSVEVKTYSALYPSDTLFPADGLYPGTLLNEVTNYD